MNRALYGTKRPIAEVAKIGLLCIPGIRYGNTGYVSDLNLYQGDESIYKAERLVAAGAAPELVDFIRESNARIEGEDKK